MKVENVVSNTPKLEIFALTDIVETEAYQMTEMHYHDELEFLLIFKGSFMCKCNNVEYLAKPGQIIFIGAGIPHETYCMEEGTEWALLQFRESNYLNTEIRKIIKYSVKLQNLENDPVMVLDMPELFDAANQVLIECRDKKNAYEIMSRSYVLRILGILYRNKILSNSEENYESNAIKKILPAINYINQHYAEDISLDDTSKTLGFDRSYFCRIFKQATGSTFVEYLNFVRVCKAEKKLSSSNESILNISNEVGFSSISYFNKVFKKYKNYSPSAYRSIKYRSNM